MPTFILANSALSSSSDSTSLVELLETVGVISRKLAQKTKPSCKITWDDLTVRWLFFRKETPQNHSKLICRPEDVKNGKKKKTRPSQKKDHEADISEIDISTSKLFGKGQIFNFGLLNFPQDQN